MQPYSVQFESATLFQMCCETGIVDILVVKQVDILRVLQYNVRNKAEMLKT